MVGNSSIFETSVPSLLNSEIRDNKHNKGSSYKRAKQEILRIYRWQGLYGGETRDENWT